jgi:hypothetical protein
LATDILLESWLVTISKQRVMADDTSCLSKVGL